MSDSFDGGAAAPAEAPVAPVADDVVRTPNPINSEPVAAEPEAAKPEPKPEKELTTREALQKAAEKVNKDNPDDAKDKSAPVKSEPVRGEGGKFASADPKPAEPVKAPEPVKSAPAADAPARFSPDAKAAWATAPEPVKAEVHRALKEMEAGIEKYRPAAEEMEQIKEFRELAKQHNTTIKQVLTQYTTLERTLKEDPLSGLETVCRYVGLSLRDVAAHVMGQTPDQSQSQSDRTIAALQQKITSLEQQVGGVAQTFQQQQHEKIGQSIAQFAADKPRFDELSPTIARLIEKGMADSLDEAYSMAEKLSPQQQQAVAQSPAAPAAEGQGLLAQTQKGSKSIAGAPSSGSNPTDRQPSSSIKESLKRAMAQAG